MPPVIGAAILTAVAPSLLGTAVFGVSTATIVGEVALTGALIGVQALVNATSDQLKTTVNLKQALAPRVRIYGRTMVSGAKAFEEVRNGNLYQAIMLASDVIDGVEAYYIGDVGVAVVNNLVQSAPWGRDGGSSYIGFDVHNGDQVTVYGLIPNAFPEVGYFLLGDIAYVGVVMLGTKAEDFQKTYPQGPDTLFRFVLRGAKVYDPRDGGTRWTQNAACCIRDFLTHKDGLNLPASMIEDADPNVGFAAFANVCDQAVPLKAGGTEPRYEINGTYDLSEEPKTVLARMCAACDGQLVFTPSGKVGIRGGVWSAPTVSITSDHILDAGFEQGAGAFDAYNRLTASFSYGLAFYQMTEIEPLNDAASQAVVGTIPQTFGNPMVTSYTQMARLAKIKNAKDNPAWKGSVTVDMVGLNAVGEDVILLSYAPVPYAAPLLATTFEVQSLTMNLDGGTVDIVLSSLTADAYAWDSATEEPDAPAAPLDIANYNFVAAPANAHATISQGTGTLVWDAPTRADATPAAQWSPTGQNQWQPMNIGADGQSATVYGLAKGQSYDFEVAFTAGGTTSNESVVANVVAP